MRTGIRILHVDDDPDFVALTATFLERSDDRFSLSGAADADAGRRYLEENPVDCVVSDYDMPGENGIEFLRTVRDTHPDLPFILFTGKGSEEVASEAISAGVSDYLQKGPESEQYELLANRIENAVEQARTRQRVHAQRQQLEQLHEATRELLLAESRGEIAERASTTARDTLGLPLNGIHFYDSERDGLVPVAVTDAVRERIGEPPVFERDEGIAWTAYETGEPQVYGDVRTAPEVLNPETRIRSEVHIPLGEHGVLVAGSTTPDDFTDADITSAKILAANVEAALNRAEREAQRHEERKRFEILFERLTQATVEVEYDGDEPIVRRVNPAFEAVFGYDAEELRGESVDSFIVPEDRQDEAVQINARVRDGARLDAEEVTRRTKSGERQFLLQNAVYEDGSGGFAIYTDITDRKERERQLERQNTRLTALFENFPEPTLAYVYRDDEPHIVQVNDAFTETFGYDRTEAVGRHIDDLVVPAAYSDEAERIDRSVRSGDSVDAVVRRATREGIGVFRFRNIRLPTDEEIDGYGIYADITEQTEREEELARKNDRLTEFATFVSHDLRNPLTVAQGRLELARSEVDNEHLAAVAEALERGNALVDEVLAEARNDEMETEAVELRRLADAGWQNVRTAGARLVVETDLVIQGNAEQLQRLFENLFRNSVEHGSTNSRSRTDDAVEHGSTNPRSQAQDDAVADGSNVTVRVGTLSGASGFYVADDGTGIPASVRERVFNEGYSESDDGVGVGLAIVEEIAEMHGWETSVTESAAGGTRFEFSGIAPTSDGSTSSDE